MEEAGNKGRKSGGRKDGGKKGKKGGLAVKSGGPEGECGACGKHLEEGEGFQTVKV